MYKQHKRLDSSVGALHMGAINPFIVSAEEIIIRKYKPRLWGNFETSEDFLYALEVLETATENDVVELHINSGGGSVDAILTLTHAMKKCAAEVGVVYTGSVASAGTFPMFFADTLEIGSHTGFLFHEAIIGQPMNTMSAAKAEVVHNLSLMENMLRDVYYGFFTEEEMTERLFKGEQIFMTTEEVMERWQRRNEILKQEMKEDESTSTTNHRNNKEEYYGQSPYE